MFLLALLAAFADFFVTESGIKKGLRERFHWGHRTAFAVSLIGLLACAVFPNYEHTPKFLGLIAAGHFGAAVFNAILLRRHDAHRRKQA